MKSIKFLTLIALLLLGKISAAQIPAGSKPINAQFFMHLPDSTVYHFPGIPYQAYRIGKYSEIRHLVDSLDGVAVHKAGTETIPGLKLFSQDVLVQGLTVGKGSYTGDSYNGNIAFGDSALFHGTSGTFNTAIGAHAMQNTTSGAVNVAIGGNAMLANTTGIYNTVIGYNSGSKITTGHNNVIIGNQSPGLTTGSSNTIIGSNAGNVNGSNIPNGDGNVFIGNSAGRGETGSYKLYLSTHRTTPSTDFVLLKGDFSTGQLNLPTAANASTGAYKVLVRNNSTGDIESVGNIVDKAYTDSIAKAKADSVGSSLSYSTGLTKLGTAVTADLSTGKSGGQSVIGGTASGNNLTLSSTTNATKGKILFGTSAYDEANNLLGIGTTSPTHTLTLPSSATGIAYYNTIDQTTNYERYRQYWGSNVFNIASESGGAGVARDIKLSSGQRYINLSSIGTNQNTIELGSGATGSNNIIAVTSGTRLNSSVNSQNVLSLYPIISQSGSVGYSIFYASPFESSIGSGPNYLINVGTNSASNNTGTHTPKFVVTTDGKIGISTAVPTHDLTLGGSGTASEAIYNTTVSTVNYERARLFWNSNQFNIATENGGTGTSRAFRLAGGAANIIIDGSSGTSKIINDIAGTTLTGGPGLINSKGVLQGTNGLAQNFFGLTPNINQTGGTTYNVLFISPFEQALSGTANYLINAGTNSAGTGSGTHTPKFTVDNSGKINSAALTASQAVFTDANKNLVSVQLTATNSTTTALSASTLNSTYSSAQLGFQVICESITGGPVIYVKGASGWLSTNATIVP